MNILNNKCLNIHDLPNEILFIIAKELNIGDVYTLTDIDERFVQIVHDPHYIRNIHNLDMTTITMKSFFDYNFSMDDRVLSDICGNILPQIHLYITKLIIEQNSIERILTINYPQLYSLSLINFEEKILFQYLKDHSILRDLLINQITYLNIDIQNGIIPQLSEITSNIFALILSLTKRLIHLNVCHLFSHRRTWISIYYLPEISHMFSNLTQLKINVETFFDCLYLLDGRLNSLSKLIINVREFELHSKPSYINGWKKLPKLKCFSLTLNTYEQEYDNQIIALLNRMINLEELILFLLVIRVNSNYIDGIQLNDDILIHMPRLKKFAFSINTGAIIENTKIRLQSNEDIRNSFIGRRYGQVGSYVFFKQMEEIGHCHIYSLPYQFEHFFGLSNSFHFQDVIYDKVRRLTMNDIALPFEHQFFKLISYYFPFLKELTIFNGEGQKDKQDSSTLIIFPHLIFLDLNSHVDYAEQFLLAKKTHLP
ncbi:unnamed protein product, partial [Rotaria sordida]